MNNNKTNFPKAVYISNKSYEWLLNYLDAEEAATRYEEEWLDWDNDFQDENGDL